MSSGMQGKVVLMTGGTSGIGRVTAIELARMGAKVVVLGRDEAKGRQLVAEVSEASGQGAEFLRCEMASLDSVKAASDRFRSSFDRLDVLVDNAGGVHGKRMMTADGFEYTFGVNHLAHFVLTLRTLDLLRKAAPSRVVVTSSTALRAGRLDFDDLMGERRYGSFKAYSQSKLANAMFTFELARRLQGTGVTANCFHPGTVRSNFGRDRGGVTGAFYRLFGAFMSSPAEGARTQIYLASSPEVEGVTGKYFSRQRARALSAAATDRAMAERLWEVSGQLTRKWLPGADFQVVGVRP